MKPKNQKQHNRAFAAQLKKHARQLGADLFGVADIRAIRENFNLDSSLLRDCNRAICLGVRVSAAVLDEIDDHPTRLYSYHYRTLNVLLDQLAVRLANTIQEKGYRALPIPASQVVDWKEQTAHLSHKHVGVLAGLGWIGRNNLLVNEKFGSQFRMVTILTDCDIPADMPLRRGCGSCFACVAACPARAIQHEQSNFGHQACFEKLKEFQRQKFVEQHICGICVKACGPPRLTAKSRMITKG